MVQVIWRGNISFLADCMTLLSLVDQIHGYAVTSHREIVVKHLEPWTFKSEMELAGDADIADEEHIGLLPPSWKVLLQKYAANQRAGKRKAVEQQTPAARYRRPTKKAKMPMSQIDSSEDEDHGFSQVFTETPALPELRTGRPPAVARLVGIL
jgi:hypothetical protein